MVFRGSEISIDQAQPGCLRYNYLTYKEPTASCQVQNTIKGSWFEVGYLSDNGLDNPRNFWNHEQGLATLAESIQAKRSLTVS